MNTIKTMPNTGTFLITWSYNSQPFAFTCKHDDGSILIYNHFTDSWVIEDIDWVLEFNPTFIVAN